MAVTATLTLKQTTLLIQQSTDVITEIKNTGPDTLSELNPANNGGSPDILVKNVDTGAVQTIRSLRFQGTPYRPINLDPGASMRQEFFLSERYEFPAPGNYELTARYTWADGEILSPPVAVQVLPSHPRNADIQSARGSIGPVTFAAWVNRPDPAREQFQLWFSQIGTTGKPKVRQCTFLCDLPGAVQPVLSVPVANSTPAAQWIVWVDQQQLFYLVHLHGDATKIRSMPLPAPGCRVVAPVFLHHVEKGRVLPGADVLLYDRPPGARNGSLHVVHLSSTSENKIDPPVTLPGAAPRWIQSAYLRQGSRQTFLVTTEGGQSDLQVISWSSVKPPSAPDHLASWSGKCVAADLTVSPENNVLGAVLLETGEGGSRRYAMQLWSYQGEQFIEGPAVPQTLPKEGIGITQAVISINGDGEAFALFETDLKGKPWLYGASNGTTAPLPPEAGQLHLPARVLLRTNVDPTIMYAVPARGFQFIKPPI